MAATAALRIAEAYPDRINDVVALSLLVGATLVIAGLFVRTLFGVANGELSALSA